MCVCVIVVVIAVVDVVVVVVVKHSSNLSTVMLQTEDNL